MRSRLKCGGWSVCLVVHLLLLVGACSLIRGALSTSTSSSSSNCDTRVAVDDKANGICQRKDIRRPAELAALRGCRVIEGSLQISLLITNSTDDYQNYTFPELKEITGYMLLFSSHKIITLRQMFPNLAVIRGQELIETHSLVIHQVR
jgi:hypothetical protein